MGKVTFSQAKNIIRRSLSEIISKSPSDKEKDKLRKYFNSCCAYCGRKIEIKGQGHLDHVIPFEEGGNNGIYNRILSCGECNSEGKRDKNWVEFLKDKNPENEKFLERKNRIENWIKFNKEIIPEETIKIFKEVSDQVLEFYDAKKKELEEFIK